MDHRGIVLNDSVGALVCLGLGHAYATPRRPIRISSRYGKTRILIFPSSSLQSLSTPKVN
jgi:hypothetical protein